MRQGCKIVHPVVNPLLEGQLEGRVEGRVEGQVKGRVEGRVEGQVDPLWFTQYTWSHAVKLLTCWWSTKDIDAEMV